MLVVSSQFTFPDCKTGTGPGPPSGLDIKCHQPYVGDLDNTGGNSYGFRASAYGGANAYGIYGYAYGGDFNYAGYFNGGSTLPDFLPKVAEHLR